MTTPPAVSGAIPFAGHLLEFMRNRGQLFKRGYQEHGPIFTIKLARHRAAIVVGATYHRRLFDETDQSLDIRKPFAFIRDLFGEVLAAAPHDAFRRHKRFIAPLFKPKHLQDDIGLIASETQAWIDTLSDTGRFELRTELARLWARVICRTLLGDAAYRQVGDELCQLFIDLDHVFDPRIPANIPVPSNLRRRRITARMKTVLHQVLEERLQYPDRFDDTLTQMLCQNAADKDPIPLNTCVAVLLAMMNAGFTSSLPQAAWTFIHLLQNPDYTKRVQDELQMHMSCGVPIDLSTLRALTYTQWAVRETARICPVFDMNPRIVERPLTMGDYVIPEGWLISTAADVAHFLPEVFTEPNRYDPTRFAPDRAEDKESHFSLVTFGGGEHKCPGMNFFMQSMTLITAMTLNQLQLHLLTASPRASTVLGPRRPEPTWVQYQRRLHSSESTSRFVAAASLS